MILPVNHSEGQHEKAGSRTSRLYIALTAGILTRLLWVLYNGVDFSGDGAVFGLMARHIADGQRYPLFFYGQSYLGPLTSYLLAPFYWFAFRPMTSLAVYAMTASSALLIVLVLCVRSLLGERIATYTALLMIFPPYYLNVWLMGCHGYLIICIVAVLFLWSFANWLRSDRTGSLKWWQITAAIAGIGWYAHPMFVYFIVPAGCMYLLALICQPRRRSARAVAFEAATGLIWFTVCSAPYWFGVLQQSSDVYNPLISAGRSAAGTWPAFVSVLTRYFPAVLSLDRGFMAFRLAVVTLYVVIAVFIMYAGIRWIAMWYGGMLYMGLLFIVGWWCMMLIFSVSQPGATVTAIRHLTPFICFWPVLIALFLAKMHTLWRVTRYALICLVLLHNLSSIRAYHYRPPDFEPVMQFLAGRDCTRGFAHYDTGYPITYMSNEDMIFAPFGSIGRHVPYINAAIISPDTGYLFDTTYATQQYMSEHFRMAVRYAQVKVTERTFMTYSLFHSLRDTLGRPVTYFTPLDARFIPEKPSFPMPDETIRSFHVIIPSATYAVTIGVHPFVSTTGEIQVTVRCIDPSDDSQLFSDTKVTGSLEQPSVVLFTAQTMTIPGNQLIVQIDMDNATSLAGFVYFVEQMSQ